MAKDDDLIIDDASEQDSSESKYIHYDIASYPSDLTLNVIKEMWDNEAIVIPSFQRNFVWDIKQSSLLIDSFLCGLPVPPVFFYIDGENKSLVIDGQQRIMSIIYFLSGYFGSEDKQKRKQVFRLDLPKGSPYRGKTYLELDPSAQRKLSYSSVLRAINIKQLDPNDDGSSSYHIFERLNTGGTPLKPQEIRNCVYRGLFADMLRDLNADKNWRLIIGKSEIDKHQKDIELMLRIFSFSYNFDLYEKPMKDFLNSVMSTHKDGKTKSCIEFKKIFPLVAKFIIENIGEKPFHLRGPLNASAMDTVVSLLINNFEKVDYRFKGAYKALLRDSSFESATSNATTDSQVIKDRAKIAKKILFGV